jgi:hypothetical protein
MTSLGLLQEVSLNLFEKKMRLNLYHKDALNKETSEPLEDDFDKPSTMPTRPLALSAQNPRLNFWDFRRSRQGISWQT